MTSTWEDPTAARIRKGIGRRQWAWDRHHTYTEAVLDRHRPRTTAPDRCYWCHELWPCPDIVDLAHLWVVDL